MPKHYNIDFKKSAVELIKTADISIFPFKTLENWITAYNKDPHVFDRDHVSPQQQIKKLEKQIRQQQETIDILKKRLPSLPVRNNSFFYYSRVFFLSYFYHL